jgi:hypothetical protein
MANGANTGTVSKMIEMESMMQPKMNHTRTIKPKITKGGKPDDKKNSFVAPVTPVIANTLE